LFPFSRGVFEDKVSNFWCILDVILKLKTNLSHDTLAKLCLSITFLFSLPSNLHLFFHPSNTTFLLSLCNTSLIFFLFSFQVHEKSILLAAIPVILTQNLSSLPSHSKLVSVWFLSISTFSMLPLLIKDGLLLPTISLSILYLTASYQFHFFSPILPSNKPISCRATSPTPLSSSPLEHILNLLCATSLIGCALITLLTVTLPPPARYPYLWPLISSAYSAFHFIFFTLYYHQLQFSCVDVTQFVNKKKLK
jgi:alpha-1,3-glucosyltransferase